MANAMKLKETLSTNVPVILRIKKRGGEYPETNYTTKEPTGRSIFLYFFENEKGEELKHYASQKDHEEVLTHFQAGESIQCVLKDSLTKDKKRITYLSFTPVDGAEAQAARTPQLKSNTAVTRQERKQDDYDAREAIRDWKLGLAGVVQAMISRGAADHVIKGEDRSENPTMNAVEWAKWIREKAQELGSDSTSS